LTNVYSWYPDASEELPESKNFAAHFYLAGQLVAFKPIDRIITDVSIGPFERVKEGKSAFNLNMLLIASMYAYIQR
jgi:hypothetical protein